MANKKISALPAAAAVNLTDLFEKVNDPAGVPVSQKATIQQLANLLGISVFSTPLMATPNITVSADGSISLVGSLFNLDQATGNISYGGAGTIGNGSWSIAADGSAVFGLVGSLTIAADGSLTVNGAGVASLSPTGQIANDNCSINNNGSASFGGFSISNTGKVSQPLGAEINIPSGANQRAGNLTLVGGTKTVANTSVTANTIVILTRKSTGGTIGFAVTYTLNAGVGFTVNSDNALDTSTYSYLLLENAP